MREFLKGLFDDDKELIDTIMAEHGKYITEAKEQIVELKDQVEQYEKQLSEERQSEEDFQKLTDENKNLKAELQMSESNVKKEFSKFVTSEVMSHVNDETDFATALNDYKKENPQYFGETVIKKVQSSPTLTGGTKESTTNDIMNDILRGSKN